MSRYRNCFYYFRGPRNAGKVAAATKQLEDNATKALINVLEHGGPNVTWSFLEEVAGVDRGAVDVEPEFYLQGGPEHPAESRVLVGLAILNEIDPKSWKDSGSKTGSRIDATIHLPGKVSVFIETKIVDLLEGAQLNRHARRWNIPEADAGSRASDLPATWNLITWSDVDQWARGQARSDLEPVPSFLVAQLIEFLKFSGLSASWVFEVQHFDFFEARPEDRDPEVQTEIRARLGSIWEQVKEDLGHEEFERTLGEARVGNLPATEDHGFAQSHDGESPTLPNLTIEIGRGEVTLNLVGTLVPQYPRLKGWLSGSQAADFISKYPTYCVDLFKRVGNDPGNGKPIMWRGSSFEHYARCEFASATQQEILVALEELEHGLDPRTEKAGVHLCRPWTRDEAVNAEGLPSEIADQIRHLIPLMNQLRE